MDSTFFVSFLSCWICLFSFSLVSLISSGFLEADFSERSFILDLLHRGNFEELLNDLLGLKGRFLDDFDFG